MENPISTISTANKICRFRPEQEWANRTPIRAAGIVVTARMAKVSRSTYPIANGGSPATPWPVIIYAITAPHEEKIRQADDVPTARWIGYPKQEHEDRYQQRTAAKPGQAGKDADAEPGDQELYNRSPLPAFATFPDLPDHADCHDQDEDRKEQPENVARDLGCCDPPGKPAEDRSNAHRQGSGPFHGPVFCGGASAPLIIVGRITASDVPNARRIASVESIPPRVESQNWTGVISDPPPTPKAPDSIPATMPVRKRIADWRIVIHGMLRNL